MIIRPSDSFEFPSKRLKRGIPRPTIPPLYFILILGWGSTNKLLHGVKYQTVNTSYRQQIKTGTIPNSITTCEMFVFLFYCAFSIFFASL